MNVWEPSTRLTPCLFLGLVHTGAELWTKAHFSAPDTSVCNVNVVQSPRRRDTVGKGHPLEVRRPWGRALGSGTSVLVRGDVQALCPLCV